MEFVGAFYSLNDLWTASSSKAEEKVVDWNFFCYTSEPQSILIKLNNLRHDIYDF